MPLPGQVKPFLDKGGMVDAGLVEDGPDHQQAVAGDAVLGVGAEAVGEADPVHPGRHQLTTNVAEVGRAPTRRVFR